MNTITVTTVIQSDLATVWDCWVNPSHITQWAFASDTWECPHAENDVREGGRFLTRMQAKDGSTGFDFTGVYTTVIPLEKIEYTIEGGRLVSVAFSQTEAGVMVMETFEMENENSREVQRDGWQAILDNFKKHTEQTHESTEK